MSNIKSLEQMKKELQDSSKDKIIEMFYNTALKLIKIESKAEESGKNRYYKQREDIDDLKKRLKYATEFIENNTSEFYCERDGLYELTFNFETNASDLLAIIEGNY